VAKHTQLAKHVEVDASSMLEQIEYYYFFIAWFSMDTLKQPWKPYSAGQACSRKQEKSLLEQSILPTRAMQAGETGKCAWRRRTLRDCAPVGRRRNRF